MHDECSFEWISVVNTMQNGKLGKLSRRQPNRQPVEIRMFLELHIFLRDMHIHYGATVSFFGLAKYQKNSNMSYLHILEDFTWIIICAVSHGIKPQTDPSVHMKVTFNSVDIFHWGTNLIHEVTAPWPNHLSEDTMLTTITPVLFIINIYFFL